MPGRSDPTGGPRPWRHAWQDAALGGAGFWRTGPGADDGPARHFTTSAHVGTALATSLVALLLEVDDRLGRPPRVDVVDVGAGRGELLAALLDAVPPGLRDRLRPVGVDVLARPDDLDERVAWVSAAAPRAVPDRVHGLLVAHEWLDEVPLDVVEVDDDGRPRLVLVDPDGAESRGPALNDLAGWAALGCDAGTGGSWLRRWWPVTHPGERAELGWSRDVAWAACVARLETGTALAIDYGHTRAQRVSGRYAAGTLAAYRDGRLAAPRPDGSVNLTAHVAVDALADAVGGTVTTQRDALRALGTSAALPAPALAAHDPSAYAHALEAASHAAELLDRSGLGSFSWVRVDR